MKLVIMTTDKDFPVECESKELLWEKIEKIRDTYGRGEKPIIPEREDLVEFILLHDDKFTSVVTLKEWFRRERIKVE